MQGVDTVNSVLQTSPHFKACTDHLRMLICDLQNWGDELLGALKQAGGKIYSNYAVGYNNVDVKAATKHGLPVGNTPGEM